MDNLPKGWVYKRVGEVAVYQKKQGIYNLPYVGMENIESKTANFLGSLLPINVKSSTFKFTEKDVLYGRLRPYLCKVLVPDFTGHCSTEIFPIRVKPTLDKQYLKYWLLSENTTKEIMATCTGTRMPRANMNKVQDFQIPLPPLSEQTRIVAKLDSLFARIDKSIALLEENIKHTKALMASVLEEVFGNEKETKLGEILTLKRGYDLPTQFRVKGEYALLGANGIIDYHKDYKAIGPGVCTGRSGSIGLVHYIKDIGISV